MVEVGLRAVSVAAPGGRSRRDRLGQWPLWPGFRARLQGGRPDRRDRTGAVRSGTGADRPLARNAVSPLSQSPGFRQPDSKACIWTVAPTPGCAEDQGLAAKKCGLAGALLLFDAAWRTVRPGSSRSGFLPLLPGLTHDAPRAFRAWSGTSASLSAVARHRRSPGGFCCRSARTPSCAAFGPRCRPRVAHPG